MKAAINGLMERDISDLFRTVNDYKIAKVILIINILLVAVYLVLHLLRRQWKKGILISGFMLSMPIVGPLYLLLGELLQAIEKIFGDRIVNMQELSFNKSRVRQLIEADAEKERNVVPLEEALLVSGRTEKRQAVLDMIKGGAEDNLSEIRNAVADQDQEIAHYAASYVADVLTRIKQQEVSLHDAFENNSTPQTCSDYVRHLRRVLDMKLFDGMERRRYLERLEDTYLWQLENAPENCTIEDMTALMRQWMDLHDMEKATQWFERIHPRCYEDLDALKGCAVFYYRSHDRDALMELLYEVSGSALELDNEALEWIRFFKQPTRVR